VPQVPFQTLVDRVVSEPCLLSFPTDTVPALAARPEFAGLIFEAKQRTLDKPLILMAAAIADLWPYIQGTPAEQEIWHTVMAQYWPGALTLVLPASPQVPPQLNPLEPSTIGIRIPNCAIARKILAQTGPLATTSANRSGQPPLQEMAEIEAEFPEVLTLLPEAIAALESSSEFSDDDLLQKTMGESSGVPSTVAKWTDQGWQILRQGAIQLLY
jgi:L-threonylcarbamoyladenylate synthase